MTPRAHLLVVDDNAAVREVWCESLILLGYDVMPAKDAAEALALFDATPFDAVLTDFLMPGMSGGQLAEAIGARSSVPVIMITGSTTDSHVARAGGRGMVVLHKPVRLSDLGEAVEQALRSRQGATS
jgi:CheY-like chemotaxis protein